MEIIFRYILLKAMCLLTLFSVTTCEMTLLNKTYFRSTKSQYDDKNTQDGHVYDFNGGRSLANNYGNNTACELEVSNKSAETFSTEVLKHKYNFVYLKIVFNGVSFEEDDQVIMYNKWIWTYKGEQGGHEYLFLPNDFGYLSFGLLWAYTLVDPMPIEVGLKKNARCGTLVGGGDADRKLGDALGNMTKRIAAMKDMYNSSYWCYTKRLHIDSDIFFHACEYAACPIQTIEYSCCKFELDFLTKERKVACQKHHYHFGAIWWILPILIGNILFAYYPLLLISVGCRLRSLARRSKRKFIKLDDMISADDSELVEIIRISKHKPPITFLSAVCGNFPACNTEGRVVSRMIRMTIICVPFLLAVIRILLDYKYADHFVKAAVAKGALVGFSTVIADYKSASRYFLRYLGGPFVALPVFVVFGGLMTVMPSNLEEVFEGGLMKFRGKSSFLLTLSPESKARLAGIQIKNATGYKLVQKTLISQAIMLLNCRFWKQTIKLLIARYQKTIYPMLKGVIKRPCLVVLPGIAVLIIYIIFCMIELLSACVYFAFPVISCFFIFLKAYVKATYKLVNGRANLGRVLALLSAVFIVPVFMYTWYMYSILFFDAFWFLTKIAIFTYTGVIAYPRLSYGYLILCLMALYYIGESFNSFRQSYQELLHISIKACQKIEEKMRSEQMKMTLLHDEGISVEVWNLIVERHRPRRIQVTFTVFQLAAIISILSISLELLFRFDKFRDLSLITHVFTALVICALPKIAKSMCAHGLRHRKQKKLLGKIKQTIQDYLNNELKTDEEDIYDFRCKRCDYEQLID